MKNSALTKLARSVEIIEVEQVTIEAIVRSRPELFLFGYFEEFNSLFNVLIKYLEEAHQKIVRAENEKRYRKR